VTSPSESAPTAGQATGHAAGRAAGSGPPPVDQALLDFAVDVASEAGELTLRWFRDRDLAVDSKADGTPVTAADRAAERLVRERIGGRFPDDGILGEEEPEHGGASGRRRSPVACRCTPRCSRSTTSTDRPSG
jgi:3'-phosphoadenosine 5'-phosphosulfate (PAPS) 3'-phosphatase